ncbi:MAG TPA: cell wall-binding repeat-containing protein [Acidimicrobiales bacterium]|nr:cell wall-binding repeat-containing protein [Acidimicrobiales bacterium]
MATAPQAANAAATVTINKVSGATRYDTSAMIAQTKYPTGVPSGNVVLAVGTNFPDALAGNYLAGQLSAPILLTPGTISDASYSKVTAALAALLPGSTKRVWILGGTSAVGADVATDLGSKGYTVTRIGGATRYDTAQMVDTQTGQVAGAGVSGNKTAIIATGANFPDALAAGPLAWAKHFPIILTDGTQTSLSTQATATLTADGIKNAIIMGGAAAINPALNAALTAAGVTIDKQFAGADRTDTATQFANYVIANYGFSNAKAIITFGGNFPDALSAGPWGGDPQVIIPSEPDGSAGTFDTAFFKALNVTMATLNQAGGALPAATATAFQTAATLGGVNGTFTTGPEVVSATILQTVTLAQATATNPAGTYVQYLFDEPISAGSLIPANWAKFAVYHSGLPNAPVFATAATDFATISTSNPSAVVVDFSTLNNSTLATTAADLTLATAAPGAVTDLQLQPNTVGSAAIGVSGSATTGAGHTTAAPDILSLAGFRQACEFQAPAVVGCGGVNAATPGMTAIDVTFDQPALVTAAGASAAAPVAATAGGPGGASGFELVLSTGLEERCATPPAGDSGTTNPSGLNVPGGNGTATITVICAPDANTPNSTLTAGQVARMVVRAGTVTDLTAAFANPLEASTSPHTATSGRPTLVSGSFVVGQTAGCPASPGQAGPPVIPALVGPPCDEVLYTFDQAVTGIAYGAAGTVANMNASGLFNLYSTAGGAVVHPGAVQLSTSNPDQIAGFFPANTINAGPKVGISVQTGAVAAPSGLTPTNLEDEVGVANGSTTTQTPGHTAGDELVNVTQSPVKDAFGTITSYAETYTFDQPLGSATTPFTAANVNVPASFLIYDSDNTPIACTSPAAVIGGSWSSANAASITCVNWGAATLNQQTTAVSAGVLGGAGAAAAITDAFGMNNTFGYVGITGTTGTPQFG